MMREAMQSRQEVLGRILQKPPAVVALMGELSLEPQNAPEYRPVVGTKCATFLSLRARGDNSLQLLLGLETDNIVVSIAENPFKEEGADPDLQASLTGMSQRHHPPTTLHHHS